MKFLKSLAVLSLASLLVGCAANPNTYDLLAKADRDEAIVLTAPVKASGSSIAGFKHHYAALPGQYVAEKQDKDGVYYFGVGRPIIERAATSTESPGL